MNHDYYSVIVDYYIVIAILYLSAKGETEMSKANEILKTNHTAQMNWLKNQRLKNNMSIYLNPKKALDAFDGLEGDSLIISDSDLEKYIARYLSDDGKKKLITTLRVAESRAKTGSQLQINITEKNRGKLDYLAKKTGMKKVDIINKLIEMADLTTVTKTEKQLEITL